MERNKMERIKELYLIEYYAKNPTTGEAGWSIEFAWVSAANKTEAKAKMSKLANFDEIITINQQSERFSLAYHEKIDTSIYIE